MQSLRIAGEQGEPQGELAITAPVVFGRLHALPVATEFLKAFPRVTLRLLLVDRVVDLAEENLDVSVRIGALPDSSLMKPPRARQGCGGWIPNSCARAR
jgi:DNA-binding transcriptional LysR family regulator